MEKITLRQEGPRIHVRGPTYPLKAQLKAIGGYCDTRNRWWVSATKAEELRALIEGPPAVADLNRLGDEVAVIGRAEYQGHAYYVLWNGLTEGGTEAMRLVTLEGDRDIWVPMKACRWIKQDARRDARGVLDKNGHYPTLQGIRRLIEQRRPR